MEGHGYYSCTTYLNKQYTPQRQLRREQVTATKPFGKGYRIFAAKKVQTISIHAVHTESVYSIVKAAILPTQ